MLWVLKKPRRIGAPITCVKTDGEENIHNYTTLTNFSTTYLVMCKVYTDVGGIKQLYHVYPPVHKIIHSLKLLDYLHVPADKPMV